MSRRDTPRFVYFIEAGKSGPIKIGVAFDIEARLRELQVGNSARLNLIVSIPGSHKDENRLHRRFKAECKGGEWFKAKGAVRDFAVSLIAMSEEERVAAIQHEPEPPKPKRAYRNRRRERAARKTYSAEEERAMLYVGDSGDIYRSAEAEAALRRPDAYDWQQYIKRQNEIEADDRRRAAHLSATGRLTY